MTEAGNADPASTAVHEPESKVRLVDVVAVLLVALSVVCLSVSFFPGAMLSSAVGFVAGGLGYRQGRSRWTRGAGTVFAAAHATLLVVAIVLEIVR